MARSWVKVHGLRECEKALSELPRATAKNVASRVLLKAAKPIAANAKTMAPDDPATGGFDLHTTIRAGKKTTRGAKHRKESPVEVYVGPRARHQHLLEFGTIKMSAQPYMRPAWDAGKDDALDTIADEIWAEISKAVSRASRKAARMR
ncbi:MAG: HK97-gp10 family putative phage morphogenesis protein [Cetobacterium sp.]